MIKPNSKPQLNKIDAEKLLAEFDLSAYPVRLLGIRGYYKQTMGNPVKNDRGIYDDAIFIITPDSFASFNGNTDPSITRSRVASLKPGGPYLYKIGMHNMKAPYEALRQYGNVTVIRDGVAAEDTDSPSNRFYIDIHKGGYSGTSSLGCQTIYPDQWLSFLHMVKDHLKRNKQKIVPYCLISY